MIFNFDPVTFTNFVLCIVILFLGYATDVVPGVDIPEVSAEKMKEEKLSE